MSLCNKAENSSFSNGFSGKIEENNVQWKNFSNWIHCICIVTFDLELGQALEVRFQSNYN